jgi:hypothetical protein
MNRHAAALATIARRRLPVLKRVKLGEVDLPALPRLFLQSSADVSTCASRSSPKGRLSQADVPAFFGFHITSALPALADKAQCRLTTHSCPHTYARIRPQTMTCFWASYRGQLYAEY